MKRSSVLSRVFFRRAAVKELVPDLKLVLVVLTVGCESHVGVYRPAGLSEDTGLDLSSLAGALADLERRNHILPDSATGEIFLVAFFRDNSFSTSARRGQARDDFAQIESSKLRLAVLKAIEQNPSCGLTSADFAQFLENQSLAFQGKGEGKVKEAAAPRAFARGTADAAASGKKRNVRPSGIVTWLPSDVPDAEAIEQRYTSDDVAGAVAALKSAGKEPVPGLVAREIERQHREHLAAEQQAAVAKQLVVADIASIDPVAQASGEQILPPTIRAMLAQKNTTHQEAAS